jgi:hypothetical protein
MDSFGHFLLHVCYTKRTALTWVPAALVRHLRSCREVPPKIPNSTAVDSAMSRHCKVTGHLPHNARPATVLWPRSGKAAARANSGTSMDMDGRAQGKLACIALKLRATP